MKKYVMLSLVVLATLVISVMALGIGVDRTFTANLRGSGEVPPVETNATGQAIFHLSKDGTELDYSLIVANMENVVASHIHLAPEGQNGPVTVFLYAGPVIAKANGVIAKGTITASNLIGPLAGSSIEDLVNRMKAGLTYVNVHTTANPSGEIRGQIK